MGKGRDPRKQRTDSERRVRQCERFARLIRVTQLLLGRGRWGPNEIACELQCSVRTIYRDITTLSMAGVPIHYDKEACCYRVPEGFRFPGVSNDALPIKLVVEQLAACQAILTQIQSHFAKKNP